MNAGIRSALFALLDDCDASDAAATSRLYTGFVREHICTDVAMLDAICAAAEGDMREGLHAVVLGDYEFGRDLEFGGRTAARVAVARQQGDASLRFLLFERCEKRSRDEVDAWLAQLDAQAQRPLDPGRPVPTATSTPAPHDAPLPPPSVAGAA
ncbi:MAG: chloride transporter, partial [Candidimonas sp.]